MTDASVRGILLADSEDAEFMRFFRIVQGAAGASGSVFFLWSPECHDGLVGDIWCEDLSGWLLPASRADEFEALWMARDPRIWSGDFEDFQVFARWAEADDETVRISFEFPLSDNAN